MVTWARYPQGLIWHVLLEEQESAKVRMHAWPLCVHFLWSDTAPLERLEGATPIETRSQMRCPTCETLLRELRDDEIDPSPPTG